jgi:hypothetical protein
MLLALCHRCWTWMEPKQDRCVECGQPVNLHEPDPDAAALRMLIGDPLLVIAEVTISRPKLPAGGVLSAYSEGLLFLPDVRILPSGGIVAVFPGEPTSTAPLSGFWNLFSRRTRTVGDDRTPADRALLATASAAERFLDSPGAMLIRRETISRIQQRGRVLRVERKPGRTAAFRIESPLPSVVENLNSLRQATGWDKIG